MIGFKSYRQLKCLNIIQNAVFKVKYFIFYIIHAGCIYIEFRYQRPAVVLTKVIHYIG